MPTSQTSVMRTKISDPTHLDRWANKPRYARDLIWGDGDEPNRLTLALSTESMPPLPSTPTNELNNPVAKDTICSHSHLFEIVTPIDVDRLASYLVTHPNQPLVSSIIHGLRYGFWPLAITDGVDRPSIVDNSHRPLREAAHIDFVRKQRDTEMALGRFSPAFETLLPGMTSIPIGVVPKPHSVDLRLVVDQTAGDHAPNSLIPREGVSVPLDNLHDLGRILLRVRLEHGSDADLVVFKSDVSQAYRRLPVSFWWQLYQIVRIDGMWHVDRNNNFGDRAAGKLWGTFMGIVLWIAIHVKFITDLLAYVDDSFSWDFADNVLFYEPYKKFLPAKQTRLLQLWDELGIPHEERKQVFGCPLTIIGFDVDPNAMTITMPPQRRSDLIAAVREFAKPGQRRPLREFQRLAGWCNWSLNAYPLLRPGLSLMYSKMAGKSRAHEPIWISASLARELSWFANQIEGSDGIHILRAKEWGRNDADLNLFCDACPRGMAFWCPSFNRGFQCHVTADDADGIFYLEALAVLSSLHWALHNLDVSPNTRIAIYTDNLNTVDMFNSLRAQPLYNPILITAVELLSTFDVQLRVFHIAGDDNIIADALSRFRFDIVHHYSPLLHVQSFEPPRLTLGAAWL